MKTYFVQDNVLKNNPPAPVVVSEANNGPFPGIEKAKEAESSGQGMIIGITCFCIFEYKWHAKLFSVKWLKHL